MDSLTQSSIDRIYGRISSQLDLSKIKNKSDLMRAIKSIPSTRKWNDSLNDFFWDMIESKEEIEEEIKGVNVPAKSRTRPRGKVITVVGNKRQKSYKRYIGPKWIDTEIKYAQKLRKDGISYMQIAKQIRRTYSSVSTKLYRLSKGGK